MRPVGEQERADDLTGLQPLEVGGHEVVQPSHGVVAGHACAVRGGHGGAAVVERVDLVARGHVPRLRG